MALAPARSHAYREIAGKLLGELAGGLWRDGELLPSESFLSRLYGVSRKTIRKALHIVEREGLIAKSQGRSSIVRHRRIEKTVGSPRDFITEAGNFGRRPKTRLDGLCRRRATLTETVLFGLGAAEEVIEISRTRMLDRLPAVAQISVLPAALGDRLPAFGQGELSLYALLKNCLGLEVVATEDVLAMSSASGHESALFKIPPASPLFRMHRKAFAADRRLVELSTSAIRPDLYVFCTCPSEASPNASYD